MIRLPPCCVVVTAVARAVQALVAQREPPVARAAAAAAGVARPSALEGLAGLADKGNSVVRVVRAAPEAQVGRVAERLKFPPQETSLWAAP
jgi:hypothetical protein